MANHVAIKCLIVGFTLTLALSTRSALGADNVTVPTPLPTCEKDKVTGEFINCQTLPKAAQFFLGNLIFSGSGGRTNRTSFTSPETSQGGPVLKIDESYIYTVRVGYIGKPIVRNVLQMCGIKPKDNSPLVNDLLIDAFKLDLDVLHGNALKSVNSKQIGPELNESTTYEAIVKYDVPLDRLVGDLAFWGQRRDVKPTDSDAWHLKGQ
jgi:hypothetical protein